MTVNKELLDSLIKNALIEDVGDGDHTSLSCIPKSQLGKAHLLIKEGGILAGVEIAQYIFQTLDPNSIFNVFIFDGKAITKGDVAFTIEAKVLDILKAERLVLNIMQRMSGIATKTHEYVRLLDGISTNILDTRKTCPGFRLLEKEAVKIGGGMNHRFGLYDMILLKDNHIDYVGGISKAIKNTHAYLKKYKKNLNIVIEARSLDDVQQIINEGGVNRILLDNFSIEDTKKAVFLINGKFKTESSGDISEKNVRQYAECGVDYISVGALTHKINSLDLSLKAIIIK